MSEHCWHVKSAASGDAPDGKKTLTLVDRCCHCGGEQETVSRSGKRDPAHGKHVTWGVALKVVLSRRELKGPEKCTADAPLFAAASPEGRA